MLAATRTMPPKPLPSAPQAEESGIDRLLGWLGAPSDGPPVNGRPYSTAPPRDGGE